VTPAGDAYAGLVLLQETRRLVLRRAVFAVNVHALKDDKVSPDGAFDAATANALAAIVSYRCDGAEFEGKLVKPPRRLMKDAERLDHVRTWLPLFDGSRLTAALLQSQKFRHARADDEWARVGIEDIEALAYLDRHPALEVLESTKGESFDEAVRTIWGFEVANNIGWDPYTDCTDDSIECPTCRRFTLLVGGGNLDAVPGQGRCIACGHERTRDDVFKEIT
jgi:hypothetical protein